MQNRGGRFFAIGDCIKPTAKPITHPARSNGKHPGGRPTKYDPSHPARLLTFIKRGGPRILKPIVVSDGAREGSRIVDHPIGKLPARFEGFCRLIGISAQTFDRWQDEYPEFREAYQKAKQIQLEQLVQGMTAGVYQVAATIFDLKNNHGYRDRQPDEVPKTETHYHHTAISVDATREDLARDILTRLHRRPAPSANGH